MKLSSIKRIFTIIAVVLLTFMVFVSKEDLGLAVPEPDNSTHQANVSESVDRQKPEMKEVFVKDVLDGDTFLTEEGEQVRFIGIDSPELYQNFALEAKELLTGLILNKTVKLEKDKTNRDREGRLLRYVYLDDLFINLEMVRMGYANIYTYPPDTKYEDKIIKAEKEAKENKRGFWHSAVIK